MLHLLLSLGLIAHPANRPDTTVTHFVAVLKPDVTAPARVMGANGTADITVSGGELDYSLVIGGVKHVTNVVALDGGHAVQLYGGPEARGSGLTASGSIAAGDVVGEPLNELLQDFRAGKVQIVVFTTEEPGGVMRGEAMAAAPAEAALQ